MPKVYTFDDFAVAIQLYTEKSISWAPAEPLRSLSHSLSPARAFSRSLALSFSLSPSLPLCFPLSLSLSFSLRVYLSR